LSLTPPNADQTPNASLESVLLTEKLYKRPSRPPDYRKETSALARLSKALAESPQTVLGALTDVILELLPSESAGISILAGDRFHWAAISGQWKSYVGGGTPSNFSPCADVLSLNRPLLFGRVEQRYPYYKDANPPVEEALLVPFFIEGKAVGTIWAAAHSESRKFDAEDERLMKSLSAFASLAYQTVLSIEKLQKQVSSGRDSENELRELNSALQNTIESGSRQLEAKNEEILKQATELRELTVNLMETQDLERRRIARELHDSVGQMLALLTMNLSSMQKTAEGTAPDMSAKLRESQKLLADISDEIRTTSYLLHPPLLEEIGLVTAIEIYMEGLRERSGLKIDLDAQRDFGRLADGKELALFRVMQECLTNVHRHSGSDTAKVRLQRHDGQAILEVEDRGKGISLQALDGAKSRGGVGLQGMRERLRHFGGELLVESVPSGTRIRASLPLGETSPEGQ